MCGISGLVSFDAGAHAAVVGKMSATLAHRGPDGEGLFIAPRRACVFGHRRLAILDLSERAAQPMSTADGRYTITFNGEIYTYRELRDRLAAHGEEVASSGDTEVLLRALARWGSAVLPDVNGMFAFALWDERDQTLMLARDQFGQKPLYWTHREDRLWFASELRALLASGFVPRRVDESGLTGYLSFGAVPEPHTIVRDVSVLPPASVLTFTPGRPPEIRPYLPPRPPKQPTSSTQLRDAFFTAVGRHLVSDAPIGLFLSGGIDSTAIAAAAARLSPAQITSLSVIFPDDPAESEERWARLAAARAGTKHVEVPVRAAEMLRLLPDAVAAMDQPTGDGINTFIVSSAARATGLKVVLSGLGGDELFGGYPTFRDIPRIRRIQSLSPRLRGAVARLVPYASGRALAKVRDVLESPNDLLSGYVVSRRAFSSRQVAWLAPELEAPSLGGLTATRQSQLRELIAGCELPDAIGVLELSVYMAQTLLRDSDCMGMSRGLEIRLPFLDATFARTALSLDAESRTPRKQPKHVFVEALGDCIPDEIRDRPKTGFQLPFRRWMPNELRDEITEGLSWLGAAGPFSGRALEELWARFVANPGRIGWFRPWLLFVLSRYLRSHALAF